MGNLERGDVPLTLNGFFLDRRGLDKVVCRHLGFWFLLSQHILSLNKKEPGKAHEVVGEKEPVKPYHVALKESYQLKKQSEKPIIEGIQHLKNLSFDRDNLERKADKYYAISIGENEKTSKDGLISRLKELLQSCQLNAAPLNVGFFSYNHAMAFRLSKKNKAGRGEYYVIEFYDPNKTVQHTRFELSSLAAVDKLSIDSFISKKDKEFYFKSTHYGTLAVYENPDSLANKPGNQIPENRPLIYNDSSNLTFLHFLRSQSADLLYKDVLKKLNKGHRCPLYPDFSAHGKWNVIFNWSSPLMLNSFLQAVLGSSP